MERAQEGQAMIRDDGPRAPARQRGAAGIEFALVFPLLFALFYAVVGYGLTMTLVESMTHAASEGARVALAVDWRAACPPPVSAACIQDAVEDAVRESVGEQLDWLPPAMRTAVLGANNRNVQVLIEEGNTLRVVVRHDDFRDNGFVPVITLPLLGDVPRVPEQLVVEGRVSLGSPAV